MQRNNGFMKEDFERFFKLRQRLFDLIRVVDEGYHKSYEGAIDLDMSFQSIYESEGNPEDPYFVIISVHCYLICSGRHEEFKAYTFKDCLDSFEEWLSGREQAIRKEM